MPYVNPITPVSAKYPAPIKPEPKKTIWQALADKLGRDPTHAEACAEVKRILTESKG